MDVVLIAMVIMVSIYYTQQAVSNFTRLDATHNFHIFCISSFLPDIAINDLDGSLDPDQTAASGALVSDKDYMKGLFVDSCKSTTGCMAYCTGLCLRLYTVFTERFG